MFILFLVFGEWMGIGGVRGGFRDVMIYLCREMKLVSGYHPLSCF